MDSWAKDATVERVVAFLVGSMDQVGLNRACAYLEAVRDSEPAVVDHTLVATIDAIRDWQRRADASATLA